MALPVEGITLDVLQLLEDHRAVVSLVLLRDARDAQVLRAGPSSPGVERQIEALGGLELAYQAGLPSGLLNTDFVAHVAYLQNLVDGLSLGARELEDTATCTSSNKDRTRGQLGAEVLTMEIRHKSNCGIR